MKVVMEMDKSFQKGQQWNKRGLGIVSHREFYDEDEVEFNIYDEPGGGE